MLAGHLWGQYNASSQPRFFLTHQLIYKSKIEKQNVNLDIFASGISPSFHLPGLEKKKNILVTKLKMFLFHTSKIEGPIILSLTLISDNTQSALINSWENNIVVRIQAKRGLGWQL